jgi:hypothetical protein
MKGDFSPMPLDTPIKIIGLGLMGAALSARPIAAIRPKTPRSGLSK